MSPLWGCTREQAGILKLRHLTCRPNGSLAEWSWGLCSSVLRVIIKPSIGQRWGCKQEYHLFSGFFSCITAWGLLVARGHALACEGWEDTKQFNKSFYGRFLLVNPHALRRLPCPIWPVSDQLTIGSGLLRVQAWLKPQDLLGPSSHTVLSKSPRAPCLLGAHGPHFYLQSLPSPALIFYSLSPQKPKFNFLVTKLIILAIKQLLFQCSHFLFSQNKNFGRRWILTVPTSSALPTLIQLGDSDFSYAIHQKGNE